MTPNPPPLTDVARGHLGQWLRMTANANETSERTLELAAVLKALIEAVESDSSEGSATQTVSANDLRDAAKYVRYWSESDNCDDTPSNIARLRCLADRLLAAAGVGL